METMASRRRPAWVVVLVLATTSVVATIQFTMIIPLVPTFPARLGAPVSDTLWILIAPLLCGTVGTPVFGRLADMYGKRRILLVCLGIVALGEAGGLIATSVWPLVASRALVGVGMAVLPVGIAILREELPPRRLGFGIAVMGTTIGIASGIGLPLGGWLDETFGYPSLFVVSLAATLAVGVLLAVAVDESRVRAGGRFDVVGAALLIVSLTAFLIALSNGNDWGWLDARTDGLVLAAVVTGAAWVLYERRTRNPVVDLGTTLSRPILLTNVASLGFGLAVYGNMLVTMSQAQVPVADGGFGLDTFGAGLVMLPAGLAAVAVTPLAGFAVQRFGGRVTMILGAAVTAVGYGSRIAPVTELWQIAVGAIVIQLGVATGVAGIGALIARLSPLEQTASSMSVNSLVRSVGSSISAAAIAAAFSLVVVSPNGVQHPSPLAFAITFAVSGCGAAFAVLIGFFVPRDGPPRSGARALVPDGLAPDGLRP